MEVNLEQIKHKLLFFKEFSNKYEENFLEYGSPNVKSITWKEIFFDKKYPLEQLIFIDRLNLYIFSLGKWKKFTLWVDKKKLKSPLCSSLPFYLRDGDEFHFKRSLLFTER